MTINSLIPYWTPTPPAAAERQLRDSLSVLANRHQRAVLRVLTESGRSLSTDELVTRLVADRTLPTTDMRPADEATVRIGLTHVDLPQLAATGFVATSHESSTVQLLAHPLLDDPHVERFLARDDAWDDRIAVLAVGRHRRICGLLAAHPDPLPRDRLAALLCAHESPRVTGSLRDFPLADRSPRRLNPSTAAVSAMAEALHHVHLPILAAAALVDYDPEAGTVAARQSPTSELWQPTVSPVLTGQFPVDCTAAGVVVRLVVTPDGGVEDAYAYSVGESAAGTVPIPVRAPVDTDRRLVETVPATETAAATRPATPTSRDRDQWLVDCWLRQQARL